MKVSYPHQISCFIRFALPCFRYKTATKAAGSIEAMRQLDDLLVQARCQIVGMKAKATSRKAMPLELNNLALLHQNLDNANE